MARLPSLSSKQIIRALRKAGFDEAPSEGKAATGRLFDAMRPAKSTLRSCPKARTFLAVRYSPSSIRQD
jgi:hypothetical protein